ncbi:MAG TPA: cytochrome c [Gemmatimonadales bacterium]|nr:cytochrome c [Gemmatimonadales bacterium]
MGSAWHEVSASRLPVTRWGSLLALVLAAACGGDRDAAPASDESTVATADTTAAPAQTPSATDTAGGATAPAEDTTPPPRDTAAKPAPRPAAAPAPKPAAAPKPAPKPRSAPEPTPDTAARPQSDTQPEQPAPQATAQAGQDTAQAAGGAAPPPLRDAYHQAPKDTVDQATYDGWKQYNLNCARCHGEDVLGTTIAPHLVMSLKPDGPIATQEAFVQVVCAGRPEKGMPSWCALGMDPAKINQIYSYVKGRSEGKVGPGRPAVRQGG